MSFAKPLLVAALIFGLIICFLAYYEIETLGYTTVPLHWLGAALGFLIVFFLLTLRINK